MTSFIPTNDAPTGWSSTSLRVGEALEIARRWRNRTNRYVPAINCPSSRVCSTNASASSVSMFKRNKG
jgi:hypothetical protein